MQLADIVIKWRTDPVRFVRDVFEVERIEPWQEKVLRELAVSDRVAVKSAKGVGKTALLSWVILWFLGTRVEAKVACTSPSAAQMFDALWAEVGKWVRRVKPEYKGLLPYEVKTDRVEIKGLEDVNFATARTARKEQPEALQGLHAANMLFVVDEASGVDDLIYEVAEGAMSTKGAKTILTGNPTRTSGYFYDCFHRDRVRWKCFTVRASDSSLVTQTYIDGMKSKWGEESHEYMVGVLGEFPSGGANTVIPLGLIEAAVVRDIEDRTSAPVWGVDVARFGADRTAVAKRKGRVLLEPVTWWSGKDLVQSSNLIADMYHAEKGDMRPAYINVDSAGLGGGVVDILKSMGLPARGVNVGERKAVKKQFLCLRDELWWRAREWFEARDCKIPRDDELIGELAAIEYDYNSVNKRYIKDKHVLGWSPDLADAFVLTFGGRSGIMINELEEQYGDRRYQKYAEADASYIGDQ